MPRKTARFLPALVLLAVSLTACGSDDDAAGAGGSVTAASSATSAASASTESTTSASSAAAAAESETGTAESETAASEPAETSAAAETKAETKAADAKGGNPCDLLTDEEVSKALGAKVTSSFTDHGPPLGGKQCLWASDSVPVRSYSLTLTRTEDLAKQIRDIGQTAPKIYEDSKKLYGESEPLPGVGDDAIYAKSNVLARKGEVFIAASCLFGTSPEAVAAVKSLTKTVVDKL